MNKQKFSSADYWEWRYGSGRSSGEGSYGKVAVFKAAVINSFIVEQDVKSVLDFGCGDGNQASFFDCQEYLGFDVSKTAIQLCKEKFEHDSSKIFTNKLIDLKPVDLTLSCEVLFHLVEDFVFYNYLLNLFKFSNRFVVIFSSNSRSIFPVSCHIKHRIFTQIIAKNFHSWQPLKKIANPYPEECFSDFYIYERIE